MPKSQVTGWNSPRRSRPRVLYVGGFLDEAIVRERGLPGHNAAGSNRMARLGRALVAVGYRPVLLSSGTSLRARVAGPLLMPERVHRTGPIPAVFARMLNMPGLNVLAAPFLMLAAVRSILRRGDVAAVMVYNFDPSLVVITLYLKFFFDGVLLQNVEDVSEPRFADWMPGSRARPLQQLLFWICMHVIARMVHGYVIPTRRFLAYLPSRKKQAVITGCIDIQAELSAADPPPLRVLYAGKIEPEHGSVAFLEALKLLDGMDAPPQIEVDISGRSTNCVGLEAELSELRHIRARSHGFVSKQAYRDLLSQAHVCLALQDPKGRYADFKTPSKVYEFLAFGKAVVSTNVGDIAEIGEKVLVLLPELSGAALAAAIGRLAKDPATAVALREAALRYAEQHFSYAAVGEVLCALISSEVQKCSSK